MVLDSAKLNKQPSVAETDLDAVFANVDEDSSDGSKPVRKKSSHSLEYVKQLENRHSEEDIEYIEKFKGSDAEKKAGD